MERNEQGCPNGYMPAHEPDELGPEWWYDKSEYIARANKLHEDNGASQKSLETPVKAQEQGLDESDRKLIRTLRAYLDSEIAESLPPEASHVESDIPTDTHRTSDSINAVAPTGNQNATMSHPDHRLLLHRHKGLDGSAQPTMCPSKAESHNSQGSVVHPVQQEQRASSSPPPMEPTTTRQNKSAKAPRNGVLPISRAPLTPSTLSVSVTPVSKNPGHLQSQPILPYQATNEGSLPPRQQSSSRALSTTSNGIATDHNVNNDCRTTHNALKHNSFRPTSAQSTNLPVSSRPTYAGGITPALKLISQNSGIHQSYQGHRQPSSTGKRSHEQVNESEETNSDLPTKCRRTQQDFPSIAEVMAQHSTPHIRKEAETPVQHNRKLSCGHGVEASTASPCQQRAPSIAAPVNRTISQASLSNSLVAPGEVFADPTNPVVAAYIDAWCKHEHTRRPARQNSQATRSSAPSPQQPHYLNSPYQSFQGRRASPSGYLGSVPAVRFHNVQETTISSPIVKPTRLRSTSMSVDEAMARMLAAMKSSK